MTTRTVRFELKLTKEENKRLQVLSERKGGMAQADLVRMWLADAWREYERDVAKKVA